MISALSSGCGSGKGPAAPNFTPIAPVIVSQPANQSTPMGLPATFSVGVSGAPLTYQWMKNGVPIPGTVSSSSFTTPAVTFADNGAEYTLTISNSLGSVTSNAASLTVTARAPQEGDLRFQQVDAASIVNGAAGEEFTNFSGWSGASFGNATGTPISVGPGCPATGSTQFGCNWVLNADALPTGLTGLSVSYQGFPFDEFGSELETLSAANTVITGLDIQPLSNTFAASWIQTSTGSGFDAIQHTVSAADFQGAVSQDGANGRVITAVSWNDGQVFYLSYGWQSDTSTVYDIQTATATFDTVSAVAQQLAGQGYIITAMGGTAADGILLVGTRVHGDTMPRPIKVIDVLQDGSPAVLNQQGYAVVGLLYNIDNKANLLADYWIGER
jgi:hypothetical protein